jgi:CelD/BcsL family acetyltransferase involved in cellulose biosynthesis
MGILEFKQWSAHSERHEIITDHPKFLSLETYWCDLYERSREYDVTQSFAWCRCSWQIAAKPQGRRLHCLVTWQGDRVVLIWPFVTHRWGLRTVGYPLGPETSEYSSVLVEAGPEADRRVLSAWSTLRKTLRTDKILLPRVKSGSALHRAIVESKIAARSVWVRPILYISWDGYQDWDSYYRFLKPKFRAELRRHRRRLSEQGNLTFETIDDSARFPVIVDWIFSHKTDWLARTKHKSVWNETEVYRNFLVATQAQMPGQIQSFILKLNDETISAVLCRISKLRLECVIATFDPAYGKYGPGQLLLEDILKWAFERRLDCDFRFGNEPYKQSWAPSTSEALTYQFVNSLRGAAFVWLKDALLSARRTGTPQVSSQDRQP